MIVSISNVDEASVIKFRLNADNTPDLILNSTKFYYKLCQCQELGTFLISILLTVSNSQSSFFINEWDYIFIKRAVFSIQFRPLYLFTLKKIGLCRYESFNRIKEVSDDELIEFSKKLVLFLTLKKLQFLIMII